jgi:hypothetical protein
MRGRMRGRMRERTAKKGRRVVMSRWSVTEHVVGAGDIADGGSVWGTGSGAGEILATGGAGELGLTNLKISL